MDDTLGGGEHLHRLAEQAKDLLEREVPASWQTAFVKLCEKTTPIREKTTPEYAAHQCRNALLSVSGIMRT